MMVKNYTVSRADREKMSAKLEASRQAALDFYVVMANSLGKSHPYTKKTLTVYRKTMRLIFDLNRLEREGQLNTLQEDISIINNKKGVCNYGTHNE